MRIKKLLIGCISFAMIFMFAFSFVGYQKVAASGGTAIEAQAKKCISKKKAKKIAKKDAIKKYKVNKSTIRDLEIEKDTKKGKKTWEVTFNARVGKKSHYYEFEYHISRKSGKILSREKEWD